MRGELPTFSDHLQELRTRTMYSVAVALVGSVVGYWQYDTILSVLMRPLHQPLYYSSPAGGFDLEFKVCLFVGLLFAIPVIVYHVFRFISPILPDRTGRAFISYVFFSCVLVIAGVSFAFIVCLPTALAFLLEFDSSQLHSLIAAPDYLNFVLRYTLGLGMIFQLPIILLIINACQPLPAARLFRSGRYVILGSFIVSAILSPTPDVVNQTIMAAPIILLYFGSVAFIILKNRVKEDMLTS